MSTTQSPMGTYTGAALSDLLKAGIKNADHATGAADAAYFLSSLLIDVQMHPDARAKFAWAVAQLGKTAEMRQLRQVLADIEELRARIARHEDAASAEEPHDRASFNESHDELETELNELYDERDRLQKELAA